MRSTPASAVLRSFALLLVALPVVGCATKGDLRSVTNELRLVRASQDSLLAAMARQSRITQDSLRGTSGQLVDIRGTVNQQLSRLQEELAISRQETAQLQSTMAAIRDQLERIGQSQPSGGGGSTGYSPVGAQPTASPSAAAELYQAAQMAFTRGSLQTARSTFEDFIQQFPNDPLAPEAQYQLADILVQENKKEEAILAFERIRSFYPTAPKVPDAVYRIGLLMLDLGRPAEARRQLQIVVDSYPSSSIAAAASEKLREIPPPPL